VLSAGLDPTSCLSCILLFPETSILFVHCPRSYRKLTLRVLPIRPLLSITSPHQTRKPGHLLFFFVKRAMSSNAGQTPTSSKAVNIPNKSLSSTFHSAPAIDASARRVGGSGSVGAGLASRNSSSPRNNQALKSQHKRQRRPRLLDDDIDESVGTPDHHHMAQLIVQVGHHEIGKQSQRTDVHYPFDELFPPPSARVPSPAAQHPSI
jgi:hypothetical protein